MKNTLITTIAIGATSALSIAGPVADISMTTATPDAFQNVIRPITNPTLADSALPTTNVRGIFLHHSIPNKVSLGGNDTPLGGYVNLYAVQFEYALNKRLSIVATKDGFIDFNPDDTLTDESGFANLAAGLKYAFIYDPANQFALSGSGVIEFPTGNRDVFQGYGDGAINLNIHALKLHGKWQFSGSAGIDVPFDGDAEALTGFASAHVSYQLTEKFTPLIELNWFTVLDEGDGTETPVSGLDFEGGDLFNWGSSNSGNDIVTIAAGFRYALTDNIDFGAAYEIPLTEETENITDSRITIDMIYKF